MEHLPAHAAIEMDPLDEDMVPPPLAPMPDANANGPRTPRPNKPRLPAGLPAQPKSAPANRRKQKSKKRRLKVDHPLSPIDLSFLKQPQPPILQDPASPMAPSPAGFQLSEIGRMRQDSESGSDDGGRGGDEVALAAIALSVGPPLPNDEDATPALPPPLLPSDERAASGDGMRHEQEMKQRLEAHQQQLSKDLAVSNQSNQDMAISLLPAVPASSQMIADAVDSDNGSSGGEVGEGGELLSLLPEERKMPHRDRLESVEQDMRPPARLKFSPPTVLNLPPPPQHMKRPRSAPPALNIYTPM